MGSTLTDEEIKALIKKLEQVKARGISETRYQGEMIRYRSVGELSKAINDLKMQLARRQNRQQNPVVKVKSTFRRDY